MENNEEKVKAFIGCLAEINCELRDIAQKGDLNRLTDMNATVKEMYRLQHGSEEEVFVAIDPDCEIVYKNFDMIVGVLRTTEDGIIDGGARTALNRLLHNINEGVVGIVTVLGLV